MSVPRYDAANHSHLPCRLFRRSSPALASRVRRASGNPDAKDSKKARASAVSMCSKAATARSLRLFRSVESIIPRSRSIRWRTSAEGISDSF